MIRIVVTGSECTGKTTLSRALAEHYRTVVVPEAVREFVDAKGAAPEYEDVDAIARLHMEIADTAARSARDILIFDTDLMSTWLYSHHYYGDCPSWVDEVLTRHPGHLYLLAGIDVPWVPDGDQRDRGHMREEMQALFRDELVRRGFQFIEIEGSREERMKQATRAVDALVAGISGS